MAARKCMLETAPRSENGMMMAVFQDREIGLPTNTKIFKRSARDG
jgi:hypothetical protein